MKMARRGEVIVLDVRPANEYLTQHLPFARSIPLDELRRRLSELPQDRPIVAYCRGPYCLMAKDAVELLRAEGGRTICTADERVGYNRRIDEVFMAWCAWMKREVR